MDDADEFERRADEGLWEWLDRVLPRVLPPMGDQDVLDEAELAELAEEEAEEKRRVAQDCKDWRKTLESILEQWSLIRQAAEEDTACQLFYGQVLAEVARRCTPQQQAVLNDLYFSPTANPQHGDQNAAAARLGLSAPAVSRLKQRALDALQTRTFDFAPVGKWLYKHRHPDLPPKPAGPPLSAEQKAQLEMLMPRLARLIRARARSYGRSHEEEYLPMDAGDVEQELWLAVVKHFAKIAAADDPLRYASTVIKTRLLDLKRGLSDEDLSEAAPPAFLPNAAALASLAKGVM